ncbi:MAG TPA: lytic transglycosylase domain-containing protein [Arenicellales bacterium]|nr:lytic transglycosylase domain-containing protein [Arenicellales bacterium]
MSAVGRSLLLALAMTTAVAAEAPVRDVTLPIRPDTAYLRQAVAAQVFTGADETVRVWDDGSGCNYLVLSDPRIDTGDGVLRVVSSAEARVGRRVGTRCLVISDWSGTIETFHEMELAPGGGAVSFRVVDSRIQDETVHAGMPMTMIWNWIKQHVHPRLAAVRIDLRPALEDLKSVLRLMIPDDPASGLADAVDSITPRSVAVEDDGLLVELGMRVPLEPAVAAEPTEALSPAELARFEAAWKGWDGFITFVIKHFAGGDAAPELRRELLEVLIEARYDLLALLAAEPARRGSDPVRALFVDTWNRLAPVLRKMSPHMPRERALNLLSFIAAADALRALDELGPGLGLDVSLDGLRRMARILAPETAEDPLEYDEQVDPELRELFDFGPPLRLRRGPEPESEPGPETGRWWRGLVPPVHAAADLEDALVERLNGWVPAGNEIEPYLQAVHRLLSETGHSLAANSELDPDLHEMFHALVLATAWQESCWRQFLRLEGKIVPMRSAAGAVGMMQVVPRVWRGFYDTDGLARDIAYNAAAGGEILMHYLVDYAIPRGEGQQPGGRENLARATYAAYNGGPRHLSRYRLAETSESLRSIDRAFVDKYRQVRDGDELAVRACYTG